MAKNYYITIDGTTPEARLEQFRQQLGKAANQEQTEDIIKEIVRCQHNLTGIHRLFERPLDAHGHTQTTIGILQEHQEALRRAEDWMDDLCPTAWTDEEELRIMLRKLEKIHIIVEQQPRVEAKWNHFYAEVFYLLNRNDYGE